MIAAGEVVEAPFSVVKELIENSLDAGAREISVEVFDSGLKKIVIRDNGSGIYKEDISLAIEEHATSKIQDIAGLENIRTYGFRGEALSSIASISDLVILSKKEDQDMGARLEVSAGEVSIGDYAGTPGTTVIVENLFFNIPARKKFLKSRRGELRYIREVFLKMAIAAHGTSFSFDVDGKRQITLQGTDDPGVRITQIFGKNILDNLYFDSLQDLKVRISGYLSKPGFVKGSKNMQFFFVNGRSVEYRFFSYHLQRAYEAIIPRGKYPAAIVFLEIEPELIDVNIHPAKREIKLFDQRYIDSLVFGLAEKILNRAHPIPDGLFKRDIAPDNDPDVSEDNTGYRMPAAGSAVHEAGNYRAPVYDRGLFDSSLSEIVSDAARLSVISRGDLIILGVVFNTYIAVQDDDKLHFIDFHAAHERILYDDIIKKPVERDIQELAFPVTMDLPVDEYNVVLENTEVFTGFGFEVEDFSDTSVVVRSVPALAEKNNIESLIKKIIDNIKDEKDDYDLKERFASSLACHSAKRAGDRMSDSDMKELVDRVLEGKFDLRCPHGRPFLYTINKNDLERIFKRL